MKNNHHNLNCLSWKPHECQENVKLSVMSCFVQWEQVEMRRPSLFIPMVWRVSETFSGLTFSAALCPGIVREMAHRSDSKLKSISTTRLSPQHHLWYAPPTRTPATAGRHLWLHLCLPLRHSEISHTAHFWRVFRCLQSAFFSRLYFPKALHRISC